jgi:hypothetical protein
MKATIQADKIKRLLRGQRVEDLPMLSYQIAEKVECTTCGAKRGEMCDPDVKGFFIGFEHWDRSLAGTRGDSAASWKNR